MKQVVQPFLFDVPKTPMRVSLYMDASGKYGQDEWLAWGLLFVRSEGEDRIVRTLKHLKRRNGRDTVLHYTDLPGTWKKGGSHKPRTVFAWLMTVPDLLQNDAWFYSLAVNVRDPRFEHDAFSRPFQLHNRFVRMALTSAIPWFFKGTQMLDISAVFHRQSFEGLSDEKRGVPGRDWDNLGEYVVRETMNDAQSRRRRSPDLWPAVTFSHSIKFLSMDPDDVEEEDLKPKCELLQLTDNLVGCTRQAIDGQATRQTKLELASIVGEWLADIRLKPWEQKLALHRRLGLSYFPSSRGPTQEGPLRLSSRVPSSRQSDLGI